MPGRSTMNLATHSDLRMLIGEEHLVGLSAAQMTILIAEARYALRETGELTRAADAARRLAASMPKRN
jgi:hypothetical protein